MFAFRHVYWTCPSHRTTCVSLDGSVEVHDFLHRSNELAWHCAPFWPIFRNWRIFYKKMYDVDNVTTMRTLRSKPHSSPVLTTIFPCESHRDMKQKWTCTAYKMHTSYGNRDESDGSNHDKDGRRTQRFTFSICFSHIQWFVDGPRQGGPLSDVSSI